MGFTPIPYLMGINFNEIENKVQNYLTIKGFIIMKIFLNVLFILFSLTHISKAGEFKAVLETDVCKVQIVHGLGERLQSAVVYSSKTETQAGKKVVVFNTKIPLFLTIDSGKLYIYCKGQAIYSYDLVSHKLDPNPLIIED